MKIPISEYDRVVELYKKHSTGVIAKLYGTSRGTISRILSKRGVEVGKFCTTNNKWVDSKSEIQLQIKRRYEDGDRISDIMSLFDIPRNGIQKILKNQGVALRSPSEESRVRKLDESFFEKIDSSEKAYFLGLLYADGCNYNNRRICLFLQKPDEYIVNRFASSISIGEFKLYRKLPRKKTHSESIGVTISSKKVATDLCRLGVVPRKSLILEFPTNEQCPTKYIWHFVRGYFDGDGSITIRRRKYDSPRIISFVGSHTFIEKLNEFLIGQGINSHAYTYKLTTSEIKICDQISVNLLYKKMYVDASNLFLTRKQKKFKVLT